jgi:hypothetical protein
MELEIRFPIPPIAIALSSFLAPLHPTPFHSHALLNAYVTCTWQTMH